ncbi:UNVERIFIED_CONTAM: hypothetical protein FKN15_031808 [Acipenser sinensis]
MQVGRYVFAGEYEDALGTCVIFEENADHDLESEVKPQLKYKCHAVKKLMMNRTFLSEKKEGEEGSDLESEVKPQLKYKCHTVKKLMMKRTFLSEKKEGEEGSGGIEVLQLSDGDFSGRPNMICSFLPKSKEVVEETRLSSASEGEVSDSEPVNLSQETNCSATDLDASACEQPEPDTGITDPVACGPLK